jgi:hypothetical protein
MFKHMKTIINPHYIYTGISSNHILQKTHSTSTTTTSRWTLAEVKVQQSLYRPILGPGCTRKLRLPDFETIGTWRWYGCQSYAPAASTPQEIFLVLFLSEPESTTVQPEELCQWKIPVTPLGIHWTEKEYLLQASYKTHKYNIWLTC